MNRKEIEDDSRKALKDLKIYRIDKEIGIMIYAQSILDWEKACQDAETHGEVNSGDNGYTQVNAYHTLKNHYATLIKQWNEKLFSPDKIKTEDRRNEKHQVKNKDDKPKGLTELLS